MTAAWPSDLPNFESGATESLPGTSVESSIANGPSIPRNRVRGKVRPFDGMIMVDGDQLATFRTFFNDTLSGGIFPFTRPHPRTGVTGVFRFRKPPPAVNASADNVFNVTFKLVQIR